MEEAEKCMPFRPFVPFVSVRRPLIGDFDRTGGGAEGRLLQFLAGTLGSSDSTRLPTLKLVTFISLLQF